MLKGNSFFSCKLLRTIIQNVWCIPSCTIWYRYLKFLDLIKEILHYFSILWFSSVEDCKLFYGSLITAVCCTESRSICIYLQIICSCLRVLRTANTSDCVPEDKEYNAHLQRHFDQQGLHLISTKMSDGCSVMCYKS
jgi:hypothetical protein